MVRTEHPTEALLSLDHEWTEGDCVEIVAPKEAHLWVRMDAAVPEGEVFCPGGRMLWRVPWGEHRLAYAPSAFASPRKILQNCAYCNIFRLFAIYPVLLS